MVPLLWHSLGKSPEFGIVDLLKPGQGGFKGLPAGNPLIDGVPGKDAPQRCIGKVPLSRVKTVPLVNESRRVFPGADRLAKDYLAAISVSRPLVKGQHSSKVLYVLGLFEHEVLRQIVENRVLLGIDNVAGRQLQATAARCSGSAKLDSEVGIVRNQPIGHFNNRNLRHG